MRYAIVGRILPERTDAWFTPQVWHAVDGATYTVSAEASQLTVWAEFPTAVQYVDAYILAEQVAQAAVSALGFALGTGFSVELVQTISEAGETKTFGVRPENLAFSPSNPIFAKASELVKKDVFFRLALRDYCRAMTQTFDCGLYCYRAIEAIESSYAGGLGRDGWAAMHAALETSREDIETIIKVFADPVRHGRWSTTKPSRAADRHRMLALTRDILVRYMDLKAAQRRDEADEAHEG